MFILEQPGDNYLPLNISWQDTLCLSLNNLETITYHCVSCDRIHCVYPWTTWRQSLTTGYLVIGYFVFILEQPGDNYISLRIPWQDTLCLSLNNLETITYHCISRDRRHCVYPWTIWRQSLTTAYLVTGYIVFILWTTLRQSLTIAYLVTGYIVFILGQPGDNHLPLGISWQNTLCLSLNNLETITYHCVSRDRIHCVYPWTSLGTVTSERVEHKTLLQRIHKTKPFQTTKVMKKKKWNTVTNKT